jgi:hypothetical protein
MGAYNALTWIKIGCHQIPKKGMLGMQKPCKKVAAG